MGIAYFNTVPQVGDYVLATKYQDGDTCDHFCIGWISGFLFKGNGFRFDVIDNNGKLFRGNGFRRAKVITSEAGTYLLNHFRDMEQAEISVWGWLVIAAKELKALEEDQ